MFKRFFTPPKQSFFLFGPRGTGKSTWLKKHYKHAFWIDLLDPEVFRFYSAAPEKLAQILSEHPKKKVVVLDEIQKVPQLLDVVHSLIEKKQGYQFIMTGSSSRKLKQQGVNLLAGRALLKHMTPFFAKEIGTSFKLEKNLKLGMLPLVLDSSSPEAVLKAYVGIYLKEEVQSEGVIRNVGDFARFLETMSFSHASQINASNIARECQVARKTVDSYLIILQDLLLSFHLSVFSKRAKRALATHEKFYYFDAGVFRSLRPQNLYDREEEMEGPALEGLLAQHLKNWTSAQSSLHQLHFWRTSSKLEVDFIVTGPSCFLALEVKNSKTLHPADFHALQAFLEDYPEATPLLLYRGKHRYQERGILCLPVDEFLKKIHPAKSLPSA
jgi:predicted AAA+ superfamily ATPase